MYFHTDSILFRIRHLKDLDDQLLGNHFNDNIITFCFLRFGPVYYIPETMATYRKNNNGICTGDKFAVMVHLHKTNSSMISATTFSASS